MYLYFRTKHIAATSFQAGHDRKPAPPTWPVAGARAASPNKFGRQVVAEELTRGFTVIREPDGTRRFGLGIIEKGKDALSPVPNPRQGKVARSPTSASRSTPGSASSSAPSKSIRRASRFSSPLGVDGAEAVDLLVVPKDTGDQWLSLYIHQPRTTPPPLPAAHERRGRRGVALPQGTAGCERALLLGRRQHADRRARRPAATASTIAPRSSTTRSKSATHREGPDSVAYAPGKHYRSSSTTRRHDRPAPLSAEAPERHRLVRCRRRSRCRYPGVSMAVAPSISLVALEPSPWPASYYGSRRRHPGV